jgi:hypothetical protein
MAYSIPASIFSIYNILINNPHTILSPSGHLAWKWSSNTNRLLKLLIKPFFLLFLFFPLLYNGHYISLILLLLYLIFIYYFGKDGSSGSIWCLSVNLTILYFILKILIIMPINEITGNSKLK